MNADRRIVPEKHVTSVLAADGEGERTQEMKDQLKNTKNPVMQVAGKWIESSGTSDTLSRVMIQGAHQAQKEPHLFTSTNKKTEKVLDHEGGHHHTKEALQKPVHHIPETKQSGHTHTAPLAPKEIHHKPLTAHETKQNGHDTHGHHEAPKGHESHNHPHKPDTHHGDEHHGKTHHDHGDEKHDHHDTHHHPIEIHGHGSHHEEHHGNDAHGHGSHGGHGHDNHGHGHHDGHGHDDHGHGHGNEHGHHGRFSSFISTGHWFGDQGAYIFGVIGRIVGEIIGYIAKLIVVLMIFGPTRTGVLTLLGALLINTFADTELPIFICAGALMVVHLILTGINQIAGGGGHGGHEGHGGGHGGHDDHGHGGGHGHH